jgi:hypothetical protein
MERTVKVFVIPSSRIPGGPPEPARELVVEARSIDGLRDAARVRLIDEGYRLRSVSFGPRGLVAYVEESK